MNEKSRDLNMLRDVMLKRKAAGESVALPEGGGPDAANTLEKFEALPIEEQLERMQQKEYTDLDEFKRKHYGADKAVRVDINALRVQTELEVGAMSPELKAAEMRFLAAGLSCEVISRGGGLEPWLKIAQQTGDVYVAHQYNRIVATERIAGFNCTTAGLGEFEYYVEV